MHLRRANARDLSRIADIIAECNTTDTLARYFIPEMEKYWTSYRVGCLHFMRGQLLLPGCVGYVVETDPSDYLNDSPEASLNKEPNVVGWAAWSRLGDSETAKKWRRDVSNGWFDMLNRTLGRYEKMYYNKVPNVDPARNKAHYEILQPILREGWDEELLKEAWELNGLYVDPKWQKRGLAKTLLDWGKEQAREEGVPVVVKGSPVGGIAYKKHGFVSLGDCGFSDYFDELQYGGVLMQLWVWVPEGKGLEDVPEKAKARRAEKKKEEQRKKEDAKK